MTLAPADAPARLLVDVRDATCAYGRQPVIEAFDLAVAPGEHTLLLGPSGSGKTSLLLMLAGLLPPRQGQVKIDGESIYGKSEASRDRWRGRHVGVIFQTLHLIPTLTVGGNLALARHAAGLPPDPKGGREMLRSLGIAPLEPRRPRSLSQGQVQRVGIARALVNHPALVLADEPTSSLDDANCRAVCDLLLARATDTGATLIIATHDRRLREAFGKHVLLPGREEPPA